MDLAGGENIRQQVRNVYVTFQPSNYGPKTHYPETKDVLMSKDLDLLAQLQKPVTVTIILDLSSWHYRYFPDHNVKPFFCPRL